MTAETVIRAVDALRPNGFTMEQKRAWLGDLENELWRELLLQSPDEWDAVRAGRELMLPDGFARLYRLYLTAMIDFGNAEYTRYSNTMALYNEERQALAAWYAARYSPADSAAVLARLGVAAYNGPEDAIVAVLPAGTAVLEAVCHVTTAFNGSDNILSLTDANGHGLLAAADINPTAAGHYRRRCLFVPDSGETVLTVRCYCPGATAGSAEFTLRVQAGKETQYGNDF